MWLPEIIRRYTTRTKFSSKCVFPSLPNELLISIGEHLGPQDLNSLIQVNQLFCSVLTPLLHKYAIEDRDSMPAMCWVAKRGHVGLVRLLLDKGLSTAVRQKRGLYPIFHAFKNGSEEMVKLLLDHGANINAVDNIERTPLLCAAYAGYDSVVSILLDKGADRNARSTQALGANSALHFAAMGGRESTVILLLEAGFDIECRNLNGRTPFHLVLDNADNSPAHLEVAHTLLIRGANVDARDNTGDTALLRLSRSYCGSVQVSRLLLEGGADVNAQSGGTYGETALRRALYNAECRPVVKILLEYGGIVLPQDSCFRKNTFLEPGSIGPRPYGIRFWWQGDT